MKVRITVASSRRSFGWASLAMAVLALGSAVAGTSEPDWGEVLDPSPPPAHAIGSPARGCLAGAATLPAEGRDYHLVRPSRGRFYGHPGLIRFIRSRPPWPTGDILPRPMKGPGVSATILGEL
jgi:murein endopeptidase